MKFIFSYFRKVALNKLSQKELVIGLPKMAYHH